MYLVDDLGGYMINLQGHIQLTKTNYQLGATCKESTINICNCCIHKGP